MKSPYLSIVIPAYNEETNIRLGALEKVSRYLEGQKYLREVIVVDDGSTDATRILLDDFAKTNKDFTIIHNAHLGKAGTVITGVQKAKGDIVLFSDLDQATPLREVEKLLPFFEQGYDVVIGSRSAKREGAPLTRLIMAKGFMWLRSMILGLHGITDTQCGFKAFRRGVARLIFSSLTLYGHKHIVKGSMVTAGFDIEVLFVAKQKGYKIKEVPVEWHYVETRRVSPLTDSIQGLFDILKIRMNAFRGDYR
jgi:dolichyl-phosphate beta-glucosyltransferase